MRRRVLSFLFAFTFLFPIARPVLANEFRCEILKWKGTVTVRDSAGTPRPARQADLLKAGDEIEVGDESYVDLAYDQDWQNITRLEANSKVEISSVVPGKLDLSQGGVFAKLKKLPQNSSFEVRTPTAVATVRGSEYRVTFIFGQTDVFNAATSRVVVYGLKEDGSVDRDTAVMIEQDEKTSVETAGKAPKAPEPMSEGEIQADKGLGGGIEVNVKEAEKKGRTATIQSIGQIEEFIREEKRKIVRHPSSAETPELSRVTDSRRRLFGGEREMAPPEPTQEEPAPEENA